ncbi:hypothetical protein [Marivita sp. GX14005]|uniref:hypothetical protein n=1 Tax=Marivita sp. GX14005 TaxID=2942276 RepID=UPI002018CBE3|nr:hypothetical protein [Marivita sp. GX14005]MCL3883297.1 hypothetical protein [Marivita sp. GX14005]
MSDPGAPGGGIWIADIAANLLCVVVIVMSLIALANPPGLSAQAGAPARTAAPLAGAAMVAMLHRRLVPEPGIGAVDLLAVGPRAAHMEGAAEVDLFVFDHAAYGSLPDAGLPRQELSVPRALRRADGGDWSGAFLALRRAGADRAAFTEGLIALLAAPTEGATPQNTRRSLLPRIKTALNALAAAMTLALILGLARRRRRIRA